MSVLASHAPRPALAEHPAFMLMLLATMERFRCTLGEVREDYWLNRAWRALTGDRTLRSRVVRVGMGSVLITGSDLGPAPEARRDRAAWRMRVQQRLLVDTGRTAEDFGMAIAYATGPVTVAEGRMHSLIAQAIGDDPGWDQLGGYLEDLTPVVVPVLCAAETVVAA